MLRMSGSPTRMAVPWEQSLLTCGRRSTPLAANHVVALRVVGTTRTYPSGAIIANHGDAMDHFIWLEAGEVEVVDVSTGGCRRFATLLRAVSIVKRDDASFCIGFDDGQSVCVRRRVRHRDRVPPPAATEARGFRGQWHLLCRDTEAVIGGGAEGVRSSLRLP